MTGLLDRLRAWLGGVFDGGTTEANEDAPPAADDPERQVVHRDDRPLEMPGTLDRSEPPSAPASASESSRPARVEVPDAEADAVSVPDAEATARADERPETADTEAETGTETEAVEPDATAPDGADDAFACSVCGTTVDDPSAPCPLCRSTDVVPAADASAAVEGDGEAPARTGRTAVSTTDDDEAVERLRDVREGE